MSARAAACDGDVMNSEYATGLVLAALLLAYLAFALLSPERF